MCRFSADGKPQFVGLEFTIHDNAKVSVCDGVKLWEGCLCSFDGCGVDEHDGDVVLNRVNAMASPAFQAVSFMRRHWIFADGANQQFNKVLGNHGEIVA